MYIFIHKSISVFYAGGHWWFFYSKASPWNTIPMPKEARLVAKEHVNAGGRLTEVKLFFLNPEHGLLAKDGRIHMANMANFNTKEPFSLKQNGTMTPSSFPWVLKCFPQPAKQTESGTARIWSLGKSLPHCVEMGWMIDGTKESNQEYDQIYQTGTGAVNGIELYFLKMVAMAQDPGKIDWNCMVNAILTCRVERLKDIRGTTRVSLLSSMAWSHFSVLRWAQLLCDAKKKTFGYPALQKEGVTL